jgi:hypothetical protein
MNTTYDHEDLIPGTLWLDETDSSMTFTWRVVAQSTNEVRMVETVVCDVLRWLRGDDGWTVAERVEGEWSPESISRYPHPTKAGWKPDFSDLTTRLMFR